MYRSPSKLPHWVSATRTARRRPLMKWGRILLLSALCALTWHRYSSVLDFGSQEIEDIQITQINTRHHNSEYQPVQKQEVLAPGTSNTPDTSESNFQQRDQKSPIQAKGDLVLPTSSRNSLQSESPDSPQEVGNEVKTLSEKRNIKRPSGESTELHHSPPLRVTNDAEQESALDKSEDEEELENSASLSKGNEKAEIGVSNTPTTLVLEASQKVIVQPQSLVIKKDTEKVSEMDQNLSGMQLQLFPPYSACEELRERAETLPEMVHIPFEEATEDLNLVGWEDQWFSDAIFDITRWGKLPEPKIDFVYTWVNGSEQQFQDTLFPYEKNSSLNDEAGQWMESHRVNRYRDWDELRYSIRSVQKYAGTFRNKIQLLVNSVGSRDNYQNATLDSSASITGKQSPLWLNNDKFTRNTVEILSQEDFFDPAEQGCLPTFNSLTIENQLFNTKSDTDRVFALSDDMLLGKVHAASDIYSPLFGPTMGFKTNSYNTLNPPSDLDARRFGEKPFLIYTSWVLNRRFGARKRKGQVHFGHSLSRSVMREAMKSFPRPALQSASQRFRGEAGFQLYSWFVTFHYTMERHREALLWSYIMKRSDRNQDGNLDWHERQAVMQDLGEGIKNEGMSTFRKRMYYNVNEALEAAGLEAPKVNVDVQWTSLDGPMVIKNIDCSEFNVNECLAPGFSASSSDKSYKNWAFSTAIMFERLARHQPKCGDCLLKLILNRVEKGLAPLLPDPKSQGDARQVVVKALWKYQYVIVDPDAYFVMITDAEQVENVLFKRLIKRKGKVGQLCLNDDVNTEDEDEVQNVKRVMTKLLESMVPDPSPFEKPSLPKNKYKSKV